MLLVLCVLILQSCTKHITGEGAIVTEDRQVDAFTKLIVHADADVQIVQGPQQLLRITGYGNLVNIYSSRVIGGELELGFENNYNIRKNNIKVYIEVPDIRKVSLNGSGNIQVSGFNNGIALGVAINGSGRVELSNNHFNDLYCTINGSGDILATTTTTSEVDATINGSGFMEVNCGKKLKVSIHGSGTVDYYGNPPLTDISINGSGKVRKR